MSTPSTTASPRLLTPTTEYFRRDGEPFFRLSPHKGLKNASIIYNSIKNLPDKTIVRGDFDKKSKPIIFFPERAKKKIGQLGNINTIKAGDVDVDTGFRGIRTGGIKINLRAEFHEARLYCDTDLLEHGRY